MTPVPRWYQTEAVNAAWFYLCSKPGNPLIVAPTGSGKSLKIAMICRDAIQKYNGRVIVLAHRQELLSQNAEKIRAVMPDLDIGIYSAGLRSRDTNHAVVLGGIQSVYKRAVDFGPRQLVIVDEAHLVPSDGEGMYKTFFGDLRQVNPNLRVVGLTATPFRTGEGKLCRPDALFQDVCYTVPIRRLIDEGYLSNLVSVAADNTVDTSGLHIRAGEFINSEMAALFSDNAKIETACREIVTKTDDRKSILIFCSGVFHAEQTARTISELTGQECGVVTGETMPLERSSMLSRFRNGSLRWLTNCDVLTTGFDAPNIDAIAILRATASPGLFSQICGRGMRIHPSKLDCRILDFGENLKRHGPLDSADYGRRKKKLAAGDGDAPTKKCPNCEELNTLNARECECGFLFPERPVARHGTNPDGSPVFESDIEPTEWFVEEVRMVRHTKKAAEPGTPDTLRVDYLCQPVGEVMAKVCKKCNTALADDDSFEIREVVDKGTHKLEMICINCESHVQWVGHHGNLQAKTISEWVCLEHNGFAYEKACKWWSERSLAVLPADIDEAISLWKRGAVATPTKIQTKPQGKFMRIIKYELDPKPESWQEEQEQEDITDGFAMVDDLPF